MEESLLRDIAERYLLPFFSGARLEAIAAKSSAKDQTVAFVTNLQTIGFKVDKDDSYRLIIGRNQNFAEKNSPTAEFAVIQAFVDCLSGMKDILSGELKDEVLSTFQRRVIAKAISSQIDHKNILSAIDQVSMWASKLYEGAPIASAIGISQNSEKSSELTLKLIGKEDYGMVLSNGFDTLLEFNENLEFVDHKVLGFPASTQKFSPFRYSAIANWTASGAGRIALTLNRLGEILIFVSGQLLFARRSGVWNFLTHEPLVSQISVPRKLEVRTAIYETLLDASFARNGACIGVVSQKSGNAWTNFVNDSDILDLAISDKAMMIAQIVNGRTFYDLPRPLRQELVAIDGSTIMDHTGKILAVGAILKLPGGSTSGGRTAAAIELGSLGLGVKVSQDGGITGYISGKGVDRATPSFRMM